MFIILCTIYTVQDEYLKMVTLYTIDKLILFLNIMHCRSRKNMEMNTLEFKFEIFLMNFSNCEIKIFLYISYFNIQKILIYRRINFLKVRKPPFPRRKRPIEMYWLFWLRNFKRNSKSSLYILELLISY